MVLVRLSVRCSSTRHKQWMSLEIGLRRTLGFSSSSSTPRSPVPPRNVFQASKPPESQLRAVYVQTHQTLNNRRCNTSTIIFWSRLMVCVSEDNVKCELNERIQSIFKGRKIQLRGIVVVRPTHSGRKFSAESIQARSSASEGKRSEKRFRHSLCTPSGSVKTITVSINV